MKSTKAAIVKSVSAVLCTLLVSYAGITNTQKICDTNLAINELSLKAAGDYGTSADDFMTQTDSSYYEDIISDNSDNTDETTAPSKEQTAGKIERSENSSTSEAKAEKPKAAKKKITLTGGLTSSDKEDVLEYYKLVSRKNADLLFTKTLSLVSINGGKNISQKMIDIFTKVARKALARNTVNDEPYPGKPDKIKASDWREAKAVNDGTYTTLYIKVVEQTDGYNGSEYEGTAGRSLRVLDGIDRALKEMNMVSVDFSKTRMTVKYLEPTIKIKVRNSTGELVKDSCEWKYTTDVYIETMESKFLAFNFHLEDAGGTVNYSVTY